MVIALPRDNWLATFPAPEQLRERGADPLPTEVAPAV